MAHCMWEDFFFFKRWFAVPSLPLRLLPTNCDINKSSSMPTLTQRGRDFAFRALRKSDNNKEEKDEERNQTI